jgi:hypothetical protein
MRYEQSKVKQDLALDFRKHVAILSICDATAERHIPAEHMLLIRQFLGRFLNVKRYFISVLAPSFISWRGSRPKLRSEKRRMQPVW